MAGRLSQLGGSTNPILSQFAVGYRDTRFIGREVAPIIPSLTRTGTIMTFGKEGFYLYDTERAMRAEAKKADFHLSTDTYTCVEHAFETQLDYEEIKEAEKYGASKILSLEKRAVGFTQLILERELEKAVADIIFSTTYYATGNKVTLSGGDQISDYANSDPQGVVDTGMAAARADMGIEPNTGVIGYTAWKVLRKHPQLLDIYKHVMKGVLTAELVAEALGLEQLLIGKSVYSTDAGVFTDIWGDYLALIYTPPNPEMAEGTTPHTIVIEEEGYPKVKTYDEKKVRSYETTRRYQVKNISTSYGYLISDLVAQGGE